MSPNKVMCDFESLLVFTHLALSSFGEIPMKLNSICPFNTRLLPVALAVSVTLALTACGGGGGASSTATGSGTGGSVAVTAASGVVIDGYLEGAVVCVDSDGDGTCKVAATGADEANRTLTAADGSYTLPNPVAEGAYILVETSGDTIDADKPDKKFSEYTAADGAIDANGNALAGGRAPYKLMAPAKPVDGQEKFIVTPLTTVVAHAMQEDPSLSTPALAAASIVGSMGVDPAKFNLFADYKATGTNALDADTKQKLGTMANVMADSMGRAQQLFENAAGAGDAAAIRKQLFKESIGQTWALMASNVKPDGGMVMDKAAFQGAMEVGVQENANAFVQRAIFTKDQKDIEVVPGPQALVENDSRNLYIGTCRDKAAFLARAGDDKKMQAFVGLDPDPLFCGDGMFGTVATLRLSKDAPWPVPMTGMYVGGGWKPAPGSGGGFFGLSGENKIFTEKGWENYDGDMNCTTGGFRPRTAGGGNDSSCKKLVATTIPESGSADQNCITFAVDGVYGEKYCFNPIPLKGKTLASLSSSCKGKDTVECKGGEGVSVFDENSYGFDARVAFAYDTYILHPTSKPAGEKDTDNASDTIEDLIKKVAEAGEVVDICDKKSTAYFSYYFSFNTAAKTMTLVGIHPPRKNASGEVGCAGGAQNASGEDFTYANSTQIGADESIEYCKLSFHDGKQDRGIYSAFCGDGKDGPLKRLKISRETAPYSIQDIKNGEATSKVFLTGAFASTKAITKAVTETLSDSSTGKAFQPSGFIATVVDQQVRFGEYWKKNVSVNELSFMSEKEKVFNATAGKLILGNKEFNGATVIEPLQAVSSK